MQFTHDWFSHNIPNWEKWLAEYRAKPTRALEIGCYEGKATCWLLENILTHQDSTITVVDTFAGSEEHRTLGVSFDTVRDTFNFNVKKWGNRVSAFTGESALVVRHFTGPYDLIYVDGSHMAADVLTDCCLVWPILSSGGILILDDYEWPGVSDDPLHRPKAGIDAFLAIFKPQYKLIACEYQVCIRKV